MMMNSAIEETLAQLRVEFIENTIDRMAVIDSLVGEMRSGTRFDAALQELLREIHSIKGLGSTFGFPSITRILHRLEDFIEVTARIDAPELHIIQIYLNRVHEIAQSEEDAPESAMARLLYPGVLDAEAIAGSQKSRIVNMLMVMPKNLQRKIIGQELTSCGFQLSMVDSPLDAIAMAVRDQPDIVFSTLEMSDLSGADLARTLHVIEKTKHQRFVLMTTSDDERLAAKNLPESAAIIHKGPHFFEELMNCLVDWGLFGKLRATG